MSRTTHTRAPDATVERASLADGTVIALRMLQADDRPAIRALFEGLSDRSRYRRFHSASNRLTPALLDTLCAMDGDRHVAIGAFAAGELVGAARYVRPHDNAAEAEVAFTVADPHQGRGIGRLLLRALARTADARGLVRFRFTVLADNGPAGRLLLGPGAASAAGSSQREGSLDLAAFLLRPPVPPATPADAPAAAAA